MPRTRTVKLRGERWGVITDLVGRAPGSILDVGCRDRGLLAHLPAGTAYVGLDLSPPADVIASAEDPLPFDDDAFRVVVLADVLEHLEHPHAALDEAMRVAADAVVVLLPNVYHFVGRARFVAGRTTDKYEFGPEHRLDRHRWVLNWTQAAAFTRGRAAGGGWRVAREHGFAYPFRRGPARVAQAVAEAVAGPDIWAWAYAARLEPATG